MGTPSTQQVLEVLGRIKDPDLGRDVVTLGMIKELEVSPQGKVSFTFELTTPACPVRDRFKSQAEDAVNELPGVTAGGDREAAKLGPPPPPPQPPETTPRAKKTPPAPPDRGGAATLTTAGQHRS